MSELIISIDDLETFSKHPANEQINALFKTSHPSFSVEGDSMSTNDKDLQLSDVEEIEIDVNGDDISLTGTPVDDGLELSFDEGESFDLGSVDLSDSQVESTEGFGDLSLNEEGEELILKEEPSQVLENLGDLSFENDVSTSPADKSTGLSLDDFDLGADDSLSLSEEPLNTKEESSPSLSLSEEADLSEEAKEKLKEIDAIMVMDASKINISSADLKAQESLDEPLVSEDLDLDSLNFGPDDDSDEAPISLKEEKSKKKKKTAPETAPDKNRGEDFRELSTAYSGEMERMHATISNLRLDREQLLAKIQKYEEDKSLQNRQSLTMRAELDEKKIELSIMRKKLNEEISELKDRLKYHDEKRLILEEKNKYLQQELDQSSQKNKIDVKRIQMRERELEQKLELLKSDAEAQIRHRDLKILELKRKIDAMEFDMESISSQEKRSVESRFELEDKLDKAIKTLRSAITVLEDEPDRSHALDAIKKSIDM